MICATEGCTLGTSGRSKYCAEHKKIAREKWRAMVADKGAERDARNEKWEVLHELASAKANLAARAIVPVPMIVSGYENDPVMEGPCGFAWVTIRPGNSSFAIWAKKHVGARKAYYGGVEIWCPLPGQGVTRKDAYCNAYAEVLRESGVRAYAGSRLD